MTVPTGEPTVIVHAVLRAGQSVQTVIVEESLTGERTPSEVGAVLPASAPPFPITGARVVLSRGSADTARLEEELSGREGIYTGVFRVEPGQAVRLRVETRDGRTVTGATTVAGGGSVWFRAGGDSLDFTAPVTFDRTRDTIAVGARPRVARGLQVEVRERFRDPGDNGLAIYLFTDSLGVRLPGNLVNPFEGDSGETVFRAGRWYDLTVAVADTTYYDFVRSGNDPFSGRGFINHLEGGVGVFGSVEVATTPLRVVGTVDDPVEGRYRFSGRLFPDTISLEMELYRDPLEPERFAAFLDGTVLFSSVHVDGKGRIQGESFSYDFVVGGAKVRFEWTRPGRGTPFPVRVTGWAATLEGVQLTGPAP